jgi:hypothetical protein
MGPNCLIVKEKHRLIQNLAECKEKECRKYINDVTGFVPSSTQSNKASMHQSPQPNQWLKVTIMEFYQEPSEKYQNHWIKY